MKRIVNIFLILFIILSVLTFPVYSNDLGTIEIVITDISGAPITETNVDDIIIVSIYLYGFQELSLVTPALHFNPNLVQVCTPDGVKLNGFRTSVPQYFERGNAIWGAGRWGVMSNDHRYPFINNTTGVIGFFASSFHFNDLIERRRLYSIYMKVVGAGNLNIRLSNSNDGRNSDGTKKPNHESYFDYFIYFQGEPWYVAYYPRGIGTCRVNAVNEIDATIHLMDRILFADLTISTDLRKATAVAEIFNNTHDEQNVKLIFALYDASGRLLNLSMVGATIDKRGRKPISTEIYPIPLPGAGYYLKAFAWEQSMLAPIVNFERYGL